MSSVLGVGRPAPSSTMDDYTRIHTNCRNWSPKSTGDHLFVVGTNCRNHPLDDDRLFVGIGCQNRRMTTESYRGPCSSPRATEAFESYKKDDKSAIIRDDMYQKDDKSAIIRDDMYQILVSGDAMPIDEN
ncbi:hypothetical protein L484_009959 [Morus notabilis]|uniref:Uncharacterized protein n=1 Tax=Morus notabilis TaxID=981085 RepID=W9RS66_9ROSA|nr:hypothetical protein L484_009959 [Morus notabilis]